jgi:SOS-response transcriptional repressor LexA
MSATVQTLTPRQAMILEFVSSRITTKGSSPTIRELMSRFGIRSPNGVLCHLKAMERKGVIVRDPHRARGIMLPVTTAAAAIELLERVVRGNFEPALFEEIHAFLAKHGRNLPVVMIEPVSAPEPVASR